ncbi:MAG: hypothetical protein LBD56_00770 [Endomicrobium sp.]|jgi:hypothetical protein|nr:hypothetical protein [Endomicrobium sp.]
MHLVQELSTFFFQLWGDATAYTGDLGFAKIYGVKVDLGKEFEFFVI